MSTGRTTTGAGAVGDLAAAWEGWCACIKALTISVTEWGKRFFMFMMTRGVHIAPKGACWQHSQFSFLGHWSIKHIFSSHSDIPIANKLGLMNIQLYTWKGMEQLLPSV